MERLSNDEVLHVANLARLDLTEEEVIKFSYQLKQLFDEINKINDIDVEVDDVLIAPWNNECVTREDNFKEFDIKEKILDSAVKRFDDFVEVRGVFDE